MSESWEDELAALRVEFVREAVIRIDALEGLINQLGERPQDAAIAQELLRKFHGFAGSGRTYGYPMVTELGQQGEQQCRDLVEAGSATLEQLVMLRELAARLRAEFAEGAVAPVQKSQAAAPAVTPRSLLLAFAPSEDAATLERLLAVEGISVQTACTVSDAQEKIARRLPDALVTDIELPDGSGCDLVRWLRDQPSGEVPPALLVATASPFLDRVEAILCGADGLFEKPVDGDTLMRRLGQLMGRGTAEPGRVLCVEDDVYQAAFVRSVLESAGYEVRACDHPGQFEAAMNAFDPDLVLMDVLLPAVSGHDLVRWLRQHERFAVLPVLYLTTAGTIEQRIAGARAGGDDYLMKPVHPSLLLTAVSARIERARFVKTLLEHDGLTRLLTHTTFLQRARALMSLRKRRDSPGAAWVMLDIDRFKSVNDRYGHPVGDRVITSLAALLRRRLRQSDILGRYGGEEFAVLLEDLDATQAVRLLDRLRIEFAGILHTAPGAAPFAVTFSAGIAMLDLGMSLDTWRQAADDQLYSAKAAGRNTVLAAAPAAPQP